MKEFILLGMRTSKLCSGIDNPIRAKSYILEFDVNMDTAIGITNLIVNVHLNILMIKIVYPFSTQSNLCPF